MAGWLAGWLGNEFTIFGFTTSSALHPLFSFLSSEAFCDKFACNSVTEGKRKEERRRRQEEEEEEKAKEESKTTRMAPRAGRAKAHKSKGEKKKKEEKSKRILDFFSKFSPIID